MSFVYPANFNGIAPKGLREIRDRASFFKIYYGHLRGAHIFVCLGRPRPFLVRIWLVATSNGIGAEKKWREYFEALDNVYSLCEFQQNRPKCHRKTRDRARFLYGHHDSGTHIFVCRDQKGRGFADFWLITPLNWVT